jgi:hypothetical protein
VLNGLSACLFGLQLNEKQLELVRSEKQLELDGLSNVKLLFGKLHPAGAGWLVKCKIVVWQTASRTVGRLVKCKIENNNKNIIFLII